MKIEQIKSFLLYCTLTKSEYDFVRPMIWRRNRKILKITTLFAIVMGGLFFFVNLISNSDVLFPYMFLTSISIVIYMMLGLSEGTAGNEAYELFLCYTEMMMICLYAGFLSIQPSNYAIPATSIIVFIAVLPMTIDDRPIRMYAVMIGETALYLLASRIYKASSSYVLDVLNAVTFCVVGMLLYSVICTRNVHEIYHSLRVERIQQSVISSLATVVEERDESTGDHISRTKQYVGALAELMKQQPLYAGLTDEYFKNVSYAAAMHDVGKIKISDAILNKPGRLTEEEFAIMKKHAAYGAEIIRKTMRDVEDQEYLTIACNIARYHHERYDGSGYPDGLRGEEIPLEARMMALADVYDALISERVYKKPFSKEKARQIIEEGSGTQFDPALVPHFLKCVE